MRVGAVPFGDGSVAGDGTSAPGIVVQPQMEHMAGLRKASASAAASASSRAMSPRARTSTVGMTRFGQ